MNQTFGFAWDLVKDFLPVGILVGTLIIGYIVRTIVLNRLCRLARHTRTQVDDILVVSLRTPFMIWCLMFAVYLVLEFSHLPPNFVQAGERLLLVLGIFSVTI